jgi:hypothetical protein
MILHDCDLRDGLHAKRWFDAVGHYSRDDVLAAQAAPRFTSGDGPAPSTAAETPTGEHDLATLRGSAQGTPTVRSSHST